MRDLAGKTNVVIDTVSAQLPAYFPEDLAESIFKGLEKSSERLSDID